MLRKIAAFCLFFLLFTVACNAITPRPTPTPQKTTLIFTYWGSDMEKAAIESMAAAFEQANPDIDVQTLQFLYEEYLARIQAMILDGKGPDLGYMPGLQAPLWAEQGKVMDLTDLVQTDPLLSSALP